MRRIVGLAAGREAAGEMDGTDGRGAQARERGVQEPQNGSDSREKDVCNTAATAMFQATQKRRDGSEEVPLVKSYVGAENPDGGVGVQCVAVPCCAVPCRRPTS